MPKVPQEDKEFTGMAGEFLVAAELNRRGIHAAVTYGSAKRADVYAFPPGSGKLARIEVKSTPLGNRKWVVGQKVLNPEQWQPNIFWVFVLLPKPIPTEPAANDEIRGAHTPRFFVYTATEIGEHISRLHRDYAEGFLRRHGKEFEGPGVVQLPTTDAPGNENRWDKILDYLHSAS